MLAIIAGTACAKMAHHSFDALAARFPHRPASRVACPSTLDRGRECCAYAGSVTTAAPANCRNSRRRNYLFTRAPAF
jgi:hypothetical protein